MRNIIFLDIDGVLNSYNTKQKIGHIKGVDDELIEQLKKIQSHMNADIVLTSTWRLFWDESLAGDGVNNWLGSSNKRYGRYLNIRLGEHGLVISGKTEDIHWSKRAKEILSWIHTHEDVENFLILDDEDFWWEDYGLSDYVVSTDNNDRKHYVGEGLQDKHVEEAIRKFEAGILKNTF